MQTVHTAFKRIGLIACPVTGGQLHVLSQKGRPDGTSYYVLGYNFFKVKQKPTISIGLCLLLQK
jgi:hypothetical protein